MGAGVGWVPDRRCPVGPVEGSQLVFVELAGGEPRELIVELEPRARTLLLGQHGFVILAHRDRRWQDRARRLFRSDSATRHADIDVWHDHALHAVPMVRHVP